MTTREQKRLLSILRLQARDALRVSLEKIEAEAENPSTPHGRILLHIASPISRTPTHAIERLVHHSADVATRLGCSCAVIRATDDTLTIHPNGNNGSLPHS
jgi:hypothetical protein